MKREPAAQRVIEIVHLARAEQTIISRLALQVPAAGIPVRPGISEVEYVNQRRVGVGAKQQRRIPVNNQEAKATACRGLTIPQLTPGGA
jgi:hypothetical protein